MKILIYAHMFPPSLGGMQYQNLQIAQGLSNLGHDVTVIACNNKGARTFVKKLNFPVYLLAKWPFAPMHSLGRISFLNWVFIPSYFLKIKKILRQNEFDIILIADETSNFYWGLLPHSTENLYISYCSVPRIAMFQKSIENDLRSKIKNFRIVLIQKAFRRSYDNAQLMLTVSSSTKKEISKEIPILSSRMYVVPNSIDDVFFKLKYNSEKVEKLKAILGIPQEAFVILSVTRLTVDKGVDDVIKSLSGFSPVVLKRLRYVIIGIGPGREYLNQLTTRMNLRETVIFTGGIPHIELIPYYDMCDLFVLPPRRGAMESFGRVFVEAAARSKPSIASKEGGMIDVIDEGITGLLISPGDINTLRKKIEFLMNNSNKLKELGENARIKAGSNYTSEKVARQFEKYFQAVIDRQLY